MFNEIDIDGGGEIDSEEFEQFLRSIASRIAEEDSDDWTSTERTLNHKMLAFKYKAEASAQRLGWGALFGTPLFPPRPTHISQPVDCTRKNSSNILYYIHSDPSRSTPHNITPWSQGSMTTTAPVSSTRRSSWMQCAGRHV